MKTLLNSFSVRLEKYPFMNIEKHPCYSDGEYFIYKWGENHYLHTFKNIIFAERCGKNIEMINYLKNDIMPENKSDQYHSYLRPKENINFGIDYAKKINFTIE